MALDEKNQQTMEPSKFCKKALFFRHSHLCHTEPRASDKLLINISFLCTFRTQTLDLLFYLGIILHLCPWKAAVSLKNCIQKQLTPLCVVKVKYDTLFICVIVCVYFVDSIDLINMFFASTSTLSITKACVYYVRNPFHLTKLCPLEHWDRLPMKLRVFWVYS